MGRVAERGTWRSGARGGTRNLKEWGAWRNTELKEVERVAERGALACRAVAFGTPLLSDRRVQAFAAPQPSRGDDERHVRRELVRDPHATTRLLDDVSSGAGDGRMHARVASRGGVGGSIAAAPLSGTPVARARARARARAPPTAATSRATYGHDRNGSPTTWRGSRRTSACCPRYGVA